MLMKYDADKVNSEIADAIHKYIADGYRIDCKESAIDKDKDKDCTFKAVLKKDVDGIECKTTITLSESGDDSNKSYTYHKVETVGDTRWSEESRSYSSSIKTAKDFKSDPDLRIKDFKSALDFHVDDGSKYTCKCPSAFSRLEDYIKLNTNTDDKKYDKSDNVKADNDKKKVPIEDLIDKSKPIKDAYDKHKTFFDKLHDEDDMDDLIKLVRYIFGR